MKLSRLSLQLGAALSLAGMAFAGTPAIARPAPTPPARAPWSST